VFGFNLSGEDRQLLPALRALPPNLPAMALQDVLRQLCLMSVPCWLLFAIALLASRKQLPVQSLPP
jgi:predicted cobalt transporter CbtA